jgi:hypothetical protein
MVLIPDPATHRPIEMVSGMADTDNSNLRNGRAVPERLVADCPVCLRFLFSLAPDGSLGVQSVQPPR